eukprot:scaffold8831_cov91-Skeletonema_dohrnii-CCMP3373.AAC.1
MSLDKGTCRDDGFNYGAAAMNSRNATDFGPWGAAKFRVRIVEGLMNLRWESEVDTWSAPVRFTANAAALPAAINVLADTWSVLVGMRALLCRPTPRDLGGRGLGNCARLQGPNATRQSKKNLSARTDLPLVLSIFQSRFVIWELPQPIPTSKSDFV